MKKIKYIIMLLCIVFFCLFVKKSFAKYRFTDDKQIEVYIDKTPPNITVQYYKKGEQISNLQNIRQIAAKPIYLTTENKLDISFEEIRQEAENEIEENQIKIESEENVDEIKSEIQEEKIEKNEKEIQENNNKSQEEEKIEEQLENLEITKNEETQEKEVEINEIIEEENSFQIPIVEAEETLLEEEPQVLVDVLSNSQIMLSAINDMYVGNETEFRNALANQVAVIHVRQSIDFTSPIYINYAVTIVVEGITNSLRYANSGSFIIVQNGGSLVLDGIVVDTNSSGISGITSINIQNGGIVTFINSSIVDAGASNTGILINSGGTLLLWSSKIVRSLLGINLQGTGSLQFATQEGRFNEFYWNTIGIYIDNFSGDCIIGQNNISMHDNNNGILTATNNGNISIWDGNYYNNQIGANCGGNMAILGGNFHNNTYGLYTSSAYYGNLILSNCNIYSNNIYAIYHEKLNDGGCTILGGSISGTVYLAQNNNYINTNTSYPTFTVTPASYYFKRKLVKTSDINYANVEIQNVNLTTLDSWYKYVHDEYIVIWQGGNVVVQCKDYYGNILNQEIINGTIGTQYQTTSKNINGYDLIEIPKNSVGIYSEQDIIVVYKYDLVNVAKVTFEDLLSGIVSAKYWYNANDESFTGDGIEFTNNNIFEKYGYYKIVVKNKIGTQSELIFCLNKDSLIR